MIKKTNGAKLRKVFGICELIIALSYAVYLLINTVSYLQLCSYEGIYPTGISLCFMGIIASALVCVSGAMLILKHETPSYKDFTSEAILLVVAIIPAIFAENIVSCDHMSLSVALALCILIVSHLGDVDLDLLRRKDETEEIDVKPVYFEMKDWGEVDDPFCCENIKCDDEEIFVFGIDDDSEIAADESEEDALGFGLSEEDSAALPEIFKETSEDESEGDKFEEDTEVSELEELKEDVCDSEEEIAEDIETEEYEVSKEDEVSEETEEVEVPKRRGRRRKDSGEESGR